MTTHDVTKRTQLISRKEASNMLGVSTMTISRYQKSGRLNPVYFSSRTVRYELKEVEKFIKESGVAMSY